MELRSAKDLFSGAALAAFGLYVIVASSRFTYSSEEGPGPGFLPLWLGIAIFALAVGLIISSQRDPAPRISEQRHSWSGETRAVSAWLGLMGAIFLSPFVGFTPSLMLMAVFIIACLERRSLWTALLAALGIGIGFHLLFVVVLGLSLPTGPLGF
jgi:putative tricarboxylic transport membrane protein